MWRARATCSQRTSRADFRIDASLASKGRSLVMGVSINEAIKLITIAPPDAIIGLVGPPGFGKSAAPRIAASQMGWSYVCRYLALMEAVEINGLPHLVDQNGIPAGRWAPFAG